MVAPEPVWGHPCWRPWAKTDSSSVLPGRTPQPRPHPTICDTSTSRAGSSPAPHPARRVADRAGARGGGATTRRPAPTRPTSSLPPRAHPRRRCRYSPTTEILQTAQATSGFQEGTAEATQAATNLGIMTRYYNDWRFLLQQIGQTKVMLHIEPDFWGYVRQAGDPTTLAAAVASANPTDCATLPATIAGIRVSAVSISMVRKYAPLRPRWPSGLRRGTSPATRSASVDVATDASACGDGARGVWSIDGRTSSSSRPAIAMLEYCPTVQNRDT